MKKKVNKITVGTRLSIAQKTELEEEAIANDMSFCAYLEHLLINRDNTSDSYVNALKEDLGFIQKERDELMEEVEELHESISDLQTAGSSETEHQGLLDKIQELENQVSELEEENNDLKIFEKEGAGLIAEDEEVNSEEATQVVLEELEMEKNELELKNEALVQQVNQLELLNAEKSNMDIKSYALDFLQEKHPNLSTTEIIKTALDCSATNEEKGWYQTVYSFTDYVERGKSFINYQNSLS